MDSAVTSHCYDDICPLLGSRSRQSDGLPRSLRLHEFVGNPLAPKDTIDERFGVCAIAAACDRVSDDRIL